MSEELEEKKSEEKKSEEKASESKSELADAIEKERTDAEKAEKAAQETNGHQHFITHCASIVADAVSSNDRKDKHKAAQYLLTNHPEHKALFEAFQVYLEKFYTKKPQEEE